MRTLRFLLLLLCSILFTSLNISLAQNVKCELNASVELNYSAGSTRKDKAVVTLTDGVGAIRYLFFEEPSGKLIQKDFSKNTAENLQKGTYYCIVVDDRGCMKKIQFQIQ